MRLSDEQYHVWLGITISKTVLELANAVAAAKLLWHVRISWTSKLAVLAAFTVRLLYVSFKTQFSPLATTASRLSAFSLTLPA